MVRPSLLVSLAALLVAPLSVAPPVTAQSAAPVLTANAVAPRQITYTQWDAGAEWSRGTLTGVRVRQGELAIRTPVGRRTRDGHSYDQGRWDSPWVAPGYGFTRLISSWSARTPGDSWVEISVRGRSKSGTTSSWDVLGQWTSGDRYTQRRTRSGQADDLADVNVDTWQADAGLTSYQLRVSLLRRAGTTITPTVDVAGAVVSRLPSGRVPTSEPGAARGRVLDVPRYSQMIHRGHYPQWGNGGQAWCSPTSTSMVLGHYDALPSRASYDWVPAGHTDPWVDYAARMTFDHDYDGTGNWAFNTAYAAPRAGKAFVTRLRSLREAERFIVAGIPVIASISFGRGELSGAPISASNGHLLVIIGFTRSGDVVVNDPAASSRSGVRRTYDRAQFENAWLPTSGGTVYVIRDAQHPLPGGTHSNW